MSTRRAASLAVDVGPTASRWWMLAAFSLLVATTQVLWLTFAPVTRESARALGVSEGLVGDLAVVNPLLFVLLALPAGRFVDRAFRPTLAAGAAFTMGGALVRLVDPASYGWQLSGQLLASVAQPLVLTATTALAARCFPPAQRTLAIAVGSAAQFVGVLAGALGGPLLVGHDGLAPLLAAHAALAVVAGVAVLALLRVVVVAPPEVRAAGGAGWAWLRHDPLLWRLAGLLLVGVGVFNALATWLDPIMAGLGHPGVAGGLIGVMTVAGIVGAAVLPGPAAARDARRALLLVATALTAGVMLVLTVVNAPLAAGALLAVLGVVLLAGLPVALDWSEAHVGAARSGTATAVLLLAGNLGGVVLVLAVQPFVGSPRLALMVIGLAGPPGLWLALGLPRRASRATPV
ncbi:MFS transporter [Phycicoccus duodecadis]|uniref:Putative MFS family arabinose efflux permease n=1 Tax=Phycicoccus duodecadis TaxID=173053 RepID=A0A2N3YLK0_9MICO|nr:MFS transporter [Phycicoccus duodecadis]PKW27737.1 putative MFS family arabinose efflux permease [Phycicoccus duodecadis]